MLPRVDASTGRLSCVCALCCRKLMQAYCAKASVDPESVAFVFDGNRLRAEQTPEEVDMEDVSGFYGPMVDCALQSSACAVGQHSCCAQNDEIQVMIHQVGG